MPDSAVTATELTIGELSHHSGVSTSALRFYERKGLIASRRTTGNQRRYHGSTVRRLAFVRASQSVGIPLSVIEAVLEYVPHEVPPTQELWRKASQCWSQDINSRIATLERTRDQFSACVDCGCLAFDQCSLVNPTGEATERSARSPLGT
ncbi:MerR family redox-sensitive transcriptional activator SoxR [Lipingzhangella halophila]|uniref:MerR family redox-sensitive transcriptional activator SoxR n=1 Tax=Lipingzhangella halophila TaxID=1783352 RepID=A0A7W7RHZ2_9ACTN|nr:redox-sensitive transcriptional activator SoxR [Lipingzhangella halophila]MBB4931928.1 MerR family redox-sensitive transcriptional activator SoxR [Lipingzhangella halophila]